MLTRVQSLLLAPHVVLADAGVPVDSILDESVLSRLGVRAALAYLRIAVDPDHVSGADLSEVHRRPSRGLPQWATKWLDRCRSISDVRRAAARIDDAEGGPEARRPRRRPRPAGLAGQACGATTRDLLTAVRDDIGLGSAMTLLDSSGGASGSHLDDLEALLQVADLHPDAGLVRGVAAAHVPPRAGRGRRHPVDHPPGEGPRVGPGRRVRGHRGPDAAPALRRTSRRSAASSTSASPGVGSGCWCSATARRRSPFLAELDGSAAPRAGAGRGGGRRPPVAAARARPGAAHHAAGRGRASGCKVLGGYEGVIEVIEDTGVRLRLDDGGSFFIRFGERITVDGSPAHAGPAAVPGRAWRPASALRAWRLERSKADGVPAYVVLSDKHLDGIAERHPTSLAELRACPGIGPAKLESYGDEILEVLAMDRSVCVHRHAVLSAHRSEGSAERHRPVGHAEAGGVDQQDRRHDDDRDPASPPRPGTR